MGVGAIVGVEVGGGVLHTAVLASVPAEHDLLPVST
jgi:hypothetical protein